MTKSDRRRVNEALDRYAQRFYTAKEEGPSMAVLLAVSVDWLRAEVKLAERFLGPDDGIDDWTDDYLYKAALSVAQKALKLDAEIREEMKKL